MSFKPQLVSVYGTLRKGCHNHTLLETSELKGSGFLDHGVMFSNGGFPILSFSEDLEAQSPIRVEVYEVSDKRAMDRLDSLEGYPRWYDRTQREFQMDDGTTVTAWIYHQDRDFTGELPVVDSGDWMDYTRSKRYG